MAVYLENFPLNEAALDLATAFITPIMPTSVLSFLGIFLMHFQVALSNAFLISYYESQE